MREVRLAAEQKLWRKLAQSGPMLKLTATFAGDAIRDKGLVSNATNTSPQTSSTRITCAKQEKGRRYSCFVGIASLTVIDTTTSNAFAAVRDTTEDAQPTLTRI